MAPFFLLCDTFHTHTHSAAQSASVVSVNLHLADEETLSGQQSPPRMVHLPGKEHSWKCRPGVHEAKCVLSASTVTCLSMEELAGGILPGCEPCTRDAVPPLYQLPRLDSSIVEIARCIMVQKSKLQLGHSCKVA